MTEFEQALRHYCRNPRCRSRLPSPVSNSREAFCTKGCHASFYRKRCLICEAEMARRNEGQLICGKRRCRNALQGRQNLGRYTAPSGTMDPHKSAHSTGIKRRPVDDRPWYIVAAGTAITAGTFYCATTGASLIPTPPSAQILGPPLVSIPSS